MQSNARRQGGFDRDILERDVPEDALVVARLKVSWEGVDCDER